MFLGFTKRITLLKQRNWGGNRAPDAETGCYGDLQNELRCKNNGIGEETARRAQSAKGKLCGRRHASKKVCEKRTSGRCGVFIFRLRLQNGAGGGMLARKIGGWRWKSGDGGGNRRTSAKKNTRDRCAVFPGGMQMGNARKGTRPPVQRRRRRHAVKKVCEKRKLDGRGGIIPTAERLRGKNYAPEK